MPRPRCPACGAPLDGGFLWTKCEYCDAKSVASWRAWRELVVAMLPLLVGIGVANLIARKDWNRNLQREGFFIVVQFFIAALFVLSRHWPSRTPKSTILELRPAAANHAPIRYIEPSGPACDPPREWGSILSSPRPRALKSGPVKIASGRLLSVALASGLVGWMLWLYHIRIEGVAWGLFAFLVIAWFFYVVFGQLRAVFESSELLRNGEVAIGWIADAWETGGFERITRVTVKFRDLVGQVYTRDFGVCSTRFSVDPGHAALVFYDPLNPARYTTPLASAAQLNEERQPLSVARAG